MLFHKTALVCFSLTFYQSQIARAETEDLEKQKIESNPYEVDVTEEKKIAPLSSFEIALDTLEVKHRVILFDIAQDILSIDGEIAEIDKRIERLNEDQKIDDTSLIADYTKISSELKTLKSKLLTTSKNLETTSRNMLASMIALLATKNQSLMDRYQDLATALADLLDNNDQMIIRVNRKRSLVEATLNLFEFEKRPKDLIPAALRKKDNFILHQGLLFPQRKELREESLKFRPCTEADLKEKRGVETPKKVDLQSIHFNTDDYIIRWNDEFFTGMVLNPIVISNLYFVFKGTDPDERYVFKLRDMTPEAIMDPHNFKDEILYSWGFSLDDFSGRSLVFFDKKFHGKHHVEAVKLNFGINKLGKIDIDLDKAPVSLDVYSTCYLKDEYDDNGNVVGLDPSINAFFSGFGQFVIP